MVEGITKEEFYKAVEGTKSIRSPEVAELSTLNITGAFKVPCRWGHKPSCSGAKQLRQAAKKMDMKIIVSCKEGTVYVLRIA